MEYRVECIRNTDSPNDDNGGMVCRRWLCVPSADSKPQAVPRTDIEAGRWIETYPSMSGDGPESRRAARFDVVGCQREDHRVLCTRVAISTLSL